MATQTQNQPQVQCWGGDIMDTKSNFFVDVTIGKTTYRYYGTYKDFKLDNVDGTSRHNHMEYATAIARSYFYRGYKHLV